MDRVLGDPWVIFDYDEFALLRDPFTVVQIRERLEVLVCMPVAEYHCSKLSQLE